MITDEVKIEVRAGKGGDGIVAFDKTKMSLGPTGGKGGNGGNVYFKGVTDLTALNKYKGKKEYQADEGKRGKGDRSDGHTGKDLILTVPVGSFIQSLDGKHSFEIIKKDDEVMAAKGGLGGRGNYLFRSSRNTSPKTAEIGKPGEEIEYYIELRLIADIGLIGLPNAGKSSLLNELTNANVRVANYAFTTLEPNLGAFGDLIIADIPGLIEGASSGKGLGIKFLKHIQRTKVLAHCISSESDSPIKDYGIIRKELKDYDKELTEKKEIIVVTKSDLVPEKTLKKMITLLKKKNPNVYVASIHDWDSLQKLSKIFSKL